MSDFKQVLNELDACTTDEEVYLLIKKTFPDWLVSYTNAYCPDYKHLPRNWEAICKQNNTTPKTIVFVKDVSFAKGGSGGGMAARRSTSHLNEEFVKQTFCEMMTKKGYVVRRESEFQPCTVCTKAIPCIQVWHLMKEKQMPVPKEWADKCSSC